ncbi:phage integrase N-terminal SAM-like domain-containing protein [Paenibacillus sp. sptzw28]|uniref:tyrosine-type recombinase/integrase n=1 Tax=Paenibacillus sp. sptzw28 TaxID=715179 RepID=UPI001C6F3BE2|nr:phage integrase N-terminal SAM-like domain-containing protein [Paenibacillus sp. sptzw28]QYR23459.1 phage integrase N-terminal SAM-like domain-containing protein [Paenibacillus sp. sptzw28]
MKRNGKMVYIQVRGDEDGYWRIQHSHDKTIWKTMISIFPNKWLTASREWKIPCDVRSIELFLSQFKGEAVQYHPSALHIPWVKELVERWLKGDNAEKERPNKAEMTDVLDDAHLRRLRERLKLRGYSPKTLKAYVLHVEHFRRYIPKTLKDVDKENITSYLIHLIDRGCSRSFINQMLSALKFFYMEVCPITFNWDFPRPKRDQKLPDVLSADEVGAILACCYT